MSVTLTQDSFNKPHHLQVKRGTEQAFHQPSVPPVRTRLPTRRSLGNMLSPDSSPKTALVVKTDSVMLPQTILTPQPFYDMLSLPGGRATADQSQLQLHSSDDSYSSSNTSLSVPASPPPHNTGHLYPAANEPTVSTWGSPARLSTASYHTLTGKIPAVVSDTSMSGMSLRSTPSSPQPKYVPMPPLRLSLLTQQSSLAALPSALPESKSFRRQALMTDDQELAEGHSALRSENGWRGTDRGYLTGGNVLQGQGQIHGDSFSCEQTPTLTQQDGLDGFPIVGLAPLAPCTYPVPYKLVSAQQQQAALAGTLQDALRNAQRQSREVVSDSGAVLENQRIARAFGEQNKARLATSASLSRAAAAKNTTQGVSNDFPFVAQNPLLADDNGFGPASFIISPRVTSNYTTLSSLGRQQIHPDNSGANTHRNLAILASTQQPPSDLADKLVNNNNKHDNANTLRAERAPSAPCVQPQHAGPRAGGSFFAAAGNAFSNVIASRLRRATTTSPSSLPFVDPRLTNNAPLGSKQTSLPRKAAPVPHKSAWENVSASKGSGVGQPIGEGLETPEWCDTASHHVDTHRARDPFQSGSESYQQKGVAEGMEDVWSSEHTNASNNLGATMSPFAPPAASFTGPGMGVATWLGHQRGAQVLQGHITAPLAAKSRALKWQAAQLHSHGRGAQGGLTGAVRKSRARFWLWVAGKRLRRLAAWLLPSTKLQARFEFMFEDMLGVSGRLAEGGRIQDQTWCLARSCRIQII